MKAADLRAKLNLSVATVSSCGQTLANSPGVSADTAPAIALDIIRKLGVPGLSRKDLKAVLEAGGYPDDLGGRVLEPLPRGGWGVYLFQASAPTPPPTPVQIPIPAPQAVVAPAPSIDGAAAALLTQKASAVASGWDPYRNPAVVSKMLATHPCVGFHSDDSDECRNCPLAAGCRTLVEETLRRLEEQVRYETLPQDNKSPREIFESLAAQKGLRSAQNPDPGCYVPTPIRVVCSSCHQPSAKDGVLFNKLAYCYPCATNALKNM